MISKEKLVNFKNKTDASLKGTGAELHFDHYGIKVPGGMAYENARDSYGDVFNEVCLNGRRVATLVGPDVVELLEPKADEKVDEMFVDHVAYWTDDFNRERARFRIIISEFKFGKTEGFKTNLNGRIIEIRNNTPMDSKGDV